MKRPDDEIHGLTQSADAMLAGPPWWLHAILFGLTVLLIVAVVIFVACLAV